MAPGLDVTKQEELVVQAAGLDQAVHALCRAVKQLRFGRPETQEALAVAHETFLAQVTQWQEVWTQVERGEHAHEQQ